MLAVHIESDIDATAVKARGEPGPASVVHLHAGRAHVGVVAEAECDDMR